MDSNTASAIIAAVIIIICAWPFILIFRNRKNTEKILLDSLTKIALENDCRISRHELFVDFAIGIDEDKGILFYSKEKTDNKEEVFVDLKEMQSARVINNGRKVKLNGVDQRVIDQLSIALSPLAPHRAEIRLEFYNSEISLQLHEQLASVEQWTLLINEHIIKAKQDTARSSKKDVVQNTNRKSRRKETASIAPGLLHQQPGAVQQLNP